jgi:hypothetical protein
VLLKARETELLLVGVAAASSSHVRGVGVVDMVESGGKMGKKE